MIFRVVLFFCLILTHTAYAATLNRVVHYEPEIVSLSGTVKFFAEKSVPDYEKDSLSERVMKWGYIKLDNRIDIISCKAIENSGNLPQKSVNILRLVSDNEKHWEKIRTGNYMRIKGTLSYSSSGIGYPKVWLTIRKIDLLGKTHKVGKWYYQDDEQNFIIE